MSDNKASRKSQKVRKLEENYWNQPQALSLGSDTPLYMLLPIILFSAVVILVVRMRSYKRDMGQFYWSSSDGSLIDFFSYYKMTLVILCAIIAIAFILVRCSLNTFYVRKYKYYIPMCIYSLFVLLSFALSDYKDFSLLGYNDRFEGTLPLLSYMVLLFFIINTVNSEKNVKQIIYPIAGMSVLLSLLGISQALDHDFFRTTFGKQLITPSSFWGSLDSLNFTFQNKEIYQTVYNINYVSFYLTLLIPLFGMLFIRSFLKGKEEPVWKKVLWGVLFFLLVYNMIGSASSGGLLGMFFVVLTAVIVLNKRVAKWWKPILILVLIAAMVFGITVNRWLPEMKSTLSGTAGLVSSSSDSTGTDAKDSEAAQTDTAKKEPGSVKPYIDYFDTEGSTVTVSLNGNPISFEMKDAAEITDINSLKILDSDKKSINLVTTEKKGYYAIDDERFLDYCTVAYTVDDDGTFYMILTTAEQAWPFTLKDGEAYFVNGVGKSIKLHPVESIGFKNSSGFGSGRGYIWSRSIPMMKDTALLGYGPDTFCLNYPHYDYAGKYNSDTFYYIINIIVDKPHCLYMGMWIGCGGIATLAFIALIIMYIIQSIRAFKKRDYFKKDDKKQDSSFLAFAGAGIFFGIVGFAISAIVDDSSVSVMPLFYGLLGTGIVINTMLLKNVSMSLATENTSDKDNKKNNK